MIKGNFFLYAMMVLEIGALIAYSVERKWTEVIYWLGVCIINIAIILRMREAAPTP